jgi:anti-sigma B factor antagonist
MHLSRRTDGSPQVVHVTEDRIDAAVAIRFKDRMREETNTTTGRVVLDLAQVDFVDSSGLGAIVAARKQLGAERPLDLTGLTENVDKVFQLTRMNTIFNIHESLDSALECRA